MSQSKISNTQEIVTTLEAVAALSFKPGMQKTINNLLLNYDERIAPVIDQLIFLGVNISLPPKQHLYIITLKTKTVLGWPLRSLLAEIFGAHFQEDPKDPKKISFFKPVLSAKKSA